MSAGAGGVKDALEVQSELLRDLQWASLDGKLRLDAVGKAMSARQGGPRGGVFPQGIVWTRSKVRD